MFFDAFAKLQTFIKWLRLRRFAIIPQAFEGSRQALSNAEEQQIEKCVYFHYFEHFDILKSRKTKKPAAGG